MENKETEFVEIARPEDAILSSHNGLISAAEYSREDLYSSARLRDEADKWIEQSKIVERSERSQLACLDIARRALFESAHRKGRIGIFIASLSGTLPEMQQALDGIVDDDPAV